MVGRVENGSNCVGAGYGTSPQKRPATTSRTDVARPMKPPAYQLETRYLEPGRRRRRRLPRAMLWLLAVALGTMLLGSVMLLAQASASGSGADCPHGAISAIGPVDAEGRGQTTRDVRCIEP